MKRIVAAALGTILVSSALSGCAPSHFGKPGDIFLVSSTWAVNDIAGQLSAGHVVSTAVLDNPNVDPHEFEPSARQRLLIQEADVVLLAGTDYDNFMQPLLQAADFESDRIVKMSKPVDKWDPTNSDNPHYWFSVQSVKKTADRLTATFIRLMPAAKHDFEHANADYQKRLSALIYREKQIAGANVLHDRKYLKLPPIDTSKLVWSCPAQLFSDPIHTGCQFPVFFAPEGLGSYLLQDVGLADATPRDITNNIANGVELSVHQMTLAKEWLASGRVKVFAANAQVSSPQILELQRYAKAQGVAILKFSETEPVPGSMSIDGPRFADFTFVIDYYLKQLAALAAK